MSELGQGLQIVAVGISGVFINLFVLMLVLLGIGRVFGKRQEK